MTTVCCFLPGWCSCSWWMGRCVISWFLQRGWGGCWLLFGRWGIFWFLPGMCIGCTSLCTRLGLLCRCSGICWYSNLVWLITCNNWDNSCLQELHWPLSAKQSSWVPSPKGAFYRFSSTWQRWHHSKKSWDLTRFERPSWDKSTRGKPT